MEEIERVLDLARRSAGGTRRWLEGPSDLALGDLFALEKLTTEAARELRRLFVLRAAALDLLPRGAGVTTTQQGDVVARPSASGDGWRNARFLFSHCRKERLRQRGCDGTGCVEIF